MSNFQEPKKQFEEFVKEVFINFLMDQGYLGEMKMTSDFIELSKNEGYVRIPIKPALNKELIITSLKTTELSFSDFEKYLEYHKAMKSFTYMVDISINKNTES
jgi:ribosomal protein S8